jgi:hypothetical protein
MLDAGDLLRSGPLQGFEKLGTVLVEVLDHADEVATAIRGKGYEATVEGLRLMAGPGDETLESTIVAAAADLDAGLVRMVRGSASLEDLFLAREANR